MSWSGGVYTKSNAGTGGWTGDAVAGIAIDATRHDTQDNDFATGINQCLTKDGQNSCTADLNFGGFRPSNVAAGSAAAPSYTAGGDTDTGAFSPTANTYAVATGGVERARIDGSGNLGIGTVTADRPLVVSSAGNTLAVGESSLLVIGQTNKERIGIRTYGTGTPVFIGQAAAGTLASPTQVITGQSLGYLGGAGYHSGNAFSATAVGINLVAAESFTSTAQGTYISLETTSGGTTTRSERVRIDSNGNVNLTSATPILNIGSAATSTQECVLQIGQGRTGSGNSYIDLIGDTTYSDYGARLSRQAGGANAETVLLHRGTGDLALVCSEVAGIRLSTQNFERMRVTSGGTVQFRGNANSSTFNTALCAQQIAFSGGGTEFGIGMRPVTDVTTAILFQNAAGTSIGSISITAAATAFNTTSDYRLKNNVEPFPDGLEKVKALSPSKWEWSADNSEGFGFIAHELQAVIPEAVTGVKDAVDADQNPIYQAVDYGKLTTVLVAAVKELTAKVESLEARLAVLEGA